MHGRNDYDDDDRGYGGDDAAAFALAGLAVGSCAECGARSTALTPVTGRCLLCREDGERMQSLPPAYRNDVGGVSAGGEASWRKRARNEAQLPPGIPSTLDIEAGVPTWSVRSMDTTRFSQRREDRLHTSEDDGAKAGDGGDQTDEESFTEIYDGTAPVEDAAAAADLPPPIEVEKGKGEGGGGGRGCSRRALFLGIMALGGVLLVLAVVLGSLAASGSMGGGGSSSSSSGSPNFAVDRDDSGGDGDDSHDELTTTVTPVSSPVATSPATTGAAAGATTDLTTTALSSSSEGAASTAATMAEPRTTTTTAAAQTTEAKTTAASSSKATTTAAQTTTAETAPSTTTTEQTASTTEVVTSTAVTSSTPAPVTAATTTSAAADTTTSPSTSTTTTTTTMTTTSQSAKCALSLKELCVVGGFDAGSEMEVKLDVFHAGQDCASPDDGVWDAFTDGNFVDVPKDGCVEVGGTVHPIGEESVVKVRIEEDDSELLFNKNDHYNWTFSGVCGAVGGPSGDLSFETEDGTFVLKLEKTSAPASCGDDAGGSTTSSTTSSAAPPAVRNPDEEYFPSEPVPTNPPPGYFNYNLSDTTYGPSAWPDLTKTNGLLDTPEYKYWSQFQNEIKRDLTENMCGTGTRQSPIDVRMDAIRGYTKDAGGIHLPEGTLDAEDVDGDGVTDEYKDGVCHEHHEIRTSPGRYGLLSDVVRPQILPNKLRLVYDSAAAAAPPSPSDPANATVALAASSPLPGADFPHQWGGRIDLGHVDVHVPSQHRVEGREFPAEYQLWHLHPRRGRAAVISIMVDEHPRDERNRHLQRALAAWQGEWERTFDKCERRRRRRRTGDAEASAEEPGNPFMTDKEDGDEHEDERQRRRLSTGDRWDPYDPAEIMRSIHFYGYSGSLTEPPCTENFVEWHVLDRPMLASREQIRHLRHLLFLYRDGEDCRRTSTHFEGAAVRRPVKEVVQAEHKVHRCTCHDFLSDEERALNANVTRCDKREEQEQLQESLAALGA